MAWLKSSGVGAAIEDWGDRNSTRETGSYMGNRCSELGRFLMCMQKKGEVSSGGAQGSGST